MSQLSFSQEWLRQFTDPYALLGLSVTADDRRILKRYRTVVKQLHPDSYAESDAVAKVLASQLLARLVNPAYQQLKQESGRAEVVTTLRFRVRQMNRNEEFKPRGEAARKLLSTPPADIEVIYEQAIASLAEIQYQELSQFAEATTLLGELNLVYLRLKMGETLIREKRTGLVPANQQPQREFPPTPPVDSPSTTSYAQRHYQRAQEYMKKEGWAMAVQELRDAIKIESNRSEYHALLAKAYLHQNLAGMAKVHFRQALKLNPKDPLALEYAKRLKIDLQQPTNGKKNKNSGGLFGGLFAKKR